MTIVQRVLPQEAEKKKKNKEYQWDIVWSNVVLLTVLHVGAFYGLYLRSYSTIYSFFFAKCYGMLASTGTTAGAHRLWSHRSYKACFGLQILLMVLMSMTYQNSIYNWCRDHRLHHRHSETDADPHNAKRGFFFSHMGWLMLRKHNDVKTMGKKVDMTDLEANPIVMFQHRHYYIIVFTFSVLVPTFTPWYFWGEDLAICFFSATLYRYIVSIHFTWSVNSLAHLYGNRPYDKNIGPCENLLTMYCSWGEGFHNYHHTFPWDYKTAEFGGDFRNVTAHVIDLFAWLGWASDLKAAPTKMILEKVKKTGDGTRDDILTAERTTTMEDFRYYAVKVKHLVVVLTWILVI